MNDLYTELSPSAQAAYAQTLDHVTLGVLHRTVANLSGTFARKKVAGHEYWYFQYRDIDSKVKQIYLGPSSERLDRLIATKDAAPPGRQDSLTRQAKAAIVLGNAPIIRTQFRILRRLEEYGFFKAGGVLIGTHAFLCYGNMLGVAWHNANSTQDVDFGDKGRSVSLALPSNLKLDVHDAISSLEMGFLPSSKLDGLVGGSYVIPHQPDFRIDFITTEGRDRSDLINFPNLNVAMIPLPFMEFSLQDISQAALLAEEGAILANVPNPARFALHKLIVAGEREGAFRTKANKDLAQSAALIRYFARHQPESLMDAWTDLDGRGKGWRARFGKGVDMLVRAMPEIAPSLIWQDRAR